MTKASWGCFKKNDGMDKHDFESAVLSLSKLGIISDQRNIKESKTGPFPFQYAINNVSFESKQLIELSNDNTGLSKYEFLKIILDNVIEKNRENHKALMEIYNVLAWAAFEEENNDYFTLNQSLIKEHFLWQNQSNTSENDLIKIMVKIIPDNSGCQECQQLASKDYEVADFLSNMPIPSKNCQKINGICLALGQPISTLNFGN